MRLSMWQATCSYKVRAQFRALTRITMAKKSTTAEETPESVLVTAAKGLGTAAGKVAALAGVKAEPAPPAKPKTTKLAVKNKSRLPRKHKKALKAAESKRG
jgi:hypothetical protein